MLRRSTNSSGTTMTVYAFGLEEHVYTGSGINQSNTYYYSLAGRLLGAMDSNGTVFYLTDALGSVLGSFSNVASGAAVKGTQVFGPYGKARYAKGTINTAKGFTGQYNDSLTGLDYYNSRYYDPVAGVFLSADSMQGNGQGLNPYAYVQGNPETMNDPAGRMYIPTTGAGGGGYSPPVTNRYPVGHGPIAVPQGPSMSTQDIMKLCAAIFSCASKVIGYNEMLLMQNVMNGLGWLAAGLELIPAGLEALSGNPEALWADEQQFEEMSTESIDLQTVEESGWGCSFTAPTKVETLHGKQAIGKVHAGEKVLAYNPQTHKMEWQPIVHVWIHQDNDLVDLTITTPAQAPSRTNKHGFPQTQEVVHTNKKHPFFTMEKGFLPVDQIKVGMHLLRADGRIGIVTAWTLVPGVQTMYNLEVAQDHTFTVGSGEWVVHNCTPGEFSAGINNLLSSSNPSIQQEAMIARLAEDENFMLTEFRRQVFRPDGSTAGDIDLGTPGAIVESKVGKSLSQANREQLSKLLGQGPDGQYLNPGGSRAVIYYAPTLNPADVNRIQNAGGYVAQNPEELIALLTFFNPSGP